VGKTRGEFRYYGYGDTSSGKSRSHIFSVRSTKKELKNFSGDQLKLKILTSFKMQMESCTSENELKEKIKGLKNSDEYKILVKGQGIITNLFSLKTDSVKAFDKMAEGILQRFNPRLPPQNKL
jgi:hypothetical protein